MYIWIACDISESYGRVREKCIENNRDLHINELAFLLPQHISLKISFRVDDSVSENVISEVASYLSDQPAFDIGEPVPELFGNILWLRFPEAGIMQELHSQLDSQLSDKFGIPRHEFDCDFIFHSTLFIDDNVDLLRKMYKRMSGIPLPKSTIINRFIIGSSDSGEAGTYSVLKIVEAKCK